MGTFSIASARIGFDEPLYFIADIAANHDGDLDRAFRLIDLAKESGAHAAKFQNFKAETIVSKSGFESLGGQVSHQASWSKSVFDVYTDASISEDWTPRLRERCDEVGIQYFSSPYDFASVDLLDPYVNVYKIGSGDVTWHEIIDYIASKGKPVMIATGASTLEEVSMAMDVLQGHTREIVLMQCNTNYTADVENFRNINLNVLKSYQEIYPDTVLGLSDHTHGHATVLGAIALGARVVEKHFTDDNDRVGPDHKFAMNPRTWREMVDRSNELYLALGDGKKRIEGNEQTTAVVQRRGLWFTNDLSKGHLLLKQDLFPLRPRQEDGVAPYEADNVLGKALRRDVKSDDYLRQEDV